MRPTARAWSLGRFAQADGPGPPQIGCREAVTPMKPENDAARLRYRVRRMRAALRLAMNPEVESILRELITDAEDQLLALEHRDARVQIRRRVKAAKVKV